MRSIAILVAGVGTASALFAMATPASRQSVPDDAGHGVRMLTQDEALGASVVSWISDRFAPTQGMTSQSSGSPVQVPRGVGVVIDGRVDDAEWQNALRIEHPAGTIARLQRDANHLYLGITSQREGFASACLAVNDEVHVLHASAALGAVTYRRNGETWQSPDTAFRYGMRSTALDDAARAQRAAYLGEHGWVASTVRMGNDGRSQELQISLTRFTPPFALALGRWLLATQNSESWPGTVTDHDGCFARQLVRGYVPQGLTFKPSYWVTIAR